MKQKISESQQSSLTQLINDLRQEIVRLQQTVEYSNEMIKNEANSIAAIRSLSGQGIPVFFHAVCHLPERNYFCRFCLGHSNGKAIKSSKEAIEKS
ncbi:hypothetical protein SAMN05421736_102108 [Evansella caseinilytica]|uniref:Uncharacterized protein n=1 Tax=Evansella caseinilytica TaxID=1503961 RepID=A0A1H3KC19_9BACI|nr:hypothetical protein [Evansella caseinilytica]SDY49716.1 hypothetical protein SAMN05421736_102108 [Evansella caseinilytica]